MGRNRKPEGVGDADERINFLVPKGFTQGTLQPLQAHFKKATMADLMRHAISELDRRRGEPPFDNLPNLARYGVHDVIPDFSEQDYTDIIRTSKRLIIYADDLWTIFRNDMYLSLMALRIAPNPFTKEYERETVVIFPAGGGGTFHKRYEYNTKLIGRFLESLTPERLALVRDGAEDKNFHFKIRALYGDHNVFNFNLLLSDDFAISCNSFALPIHARLGLVVKKPSVSEKHIVHSLHVKGEKEMPSHVSVSGIDFYAQYEAMLHFTSAFAKDFIRPWCERNAK